MVDSTLVNAAKSILQHNFKCKKGENVVALCDNHNICDAISEGAKSLSLFPDTIYIPPSQRPLEKVSKGLEEILKTADIIMTPMERRDGEFIYRRRVRNIVMGKGKARIGTMVGMREDIFSHKAVFKKPKDMKVLSYSLAEILTKGNELRIYTDIGTDIKFILGRWNRTAEPSIAELYTRRTIGNIPSGESYISPIENSANGKIVIDGSIPQYPPLSESGELVTLYVENGVVNKIEGDKAANILRDRLNQVGTSFNQYPMENLRTIGEIGIGLNDFAEIIGIPIMDEKVYGTAHVALGDNTLLGGENKAPIHQDLVMVEPTILIDDVEILSKKKFNKKVIKELCEEDYKDIDIGDFSTSNIVNIRKKFQGVEKKNGKLYRRYKSPSGSIRLTQVGDSYTANIALKICEYLESCGENNCENISDVLKMDLNEITQVLFVMCKYNLLKLKNNP
ncbi:MAG: aminopeptidase [Promethearchaeota archaeon]